LPELEKGDARDQVGKDFGMPGRSVDYANEVFTGGVTASGAVFHSNGTAPIRGHKNKLATGETEAR
jgi:hypothetical protein